MKQSISVSMQMKFFIKEEISRNRTKYVYWSLVDSGVRREKELSKAIGTLLALLSIDVYQLT